MTAANHDAWISLARDGVPTKVIARAFGVRPASVRAVVGSRAKPRKPASLSDRAAKYAMRDGQTLMSAARKYGINRISVRQAVRRIVSRAEYAALVRRWQLVGSNNTAKKVRIYSAACVRRWERMAKTMSIAEIARRARKPYASVYAVLRLRTGSLHRE